jgi:hypothetical protein
LGRESVAQEFPNTRTEPSAGFKRPMTQRKSEVLPTPFCPKIPKIMPGFAVKSIWRKTHGSCLSYRKASCFTSSKGEGMS